MTAYIGSTAGAWDKGLVRIRGIDSLKAYIGETADINFANDDHLTIVDDFGLWAKPILVSAGVPYMDGGIAYSDQHSNWLPLPRMGSHRVGKLTGATISFAFDFSGSYVPLSSISAYSTSSPTASGISGGSTSTPTVSFDETGWHTVYLTITAANGKTFFGVRYVFVWNDEDPPPEVFFPSSPRGDVDSGGWEASIALYEGADTSAIRERALVILFREDHYGDTAEEIGPIEGAENIEFIGWIGGREEIEWNPEAGSVSFVAYGAHYWLGKIPAWPDGVEYTTGSPSAWTQIKNLTVDLGLYHFLHWRTTAPRIMDIYFSADTRFSKEVGSLAGDIWSQIREIAFDQIYARPLVNSYNQLYIEVHPQLVPTGSRSWPTVQTIEKRDWIQPIELDRITTEELSILDLSGVAINSAGKGSAFFALAPGHSHSHYGQTEAQPRRLLASQAQANIQAGLFRSWRNNPFGPIPVKLTGNNKLIDIAPRSKCLISIAADDTPRGISYSGGLLPLSVERVFDVRSGYLRTDVTFEAETFEGLATVGDFPGSGDVSIPPLPSLPPLPPIDIILPGTSEPTPEGTQSVLLHTSTYGFLYSSNFNDAAPDWIAVNAGLDSVGFGGDPENYGVFMYVTPSGVFYVGRTKVVSNTDYLVYSPYIARAPSIGSTFEILIDEPSIRPSGSLSGHQWGIWAAGINTLQPDYFAAIWGVNGVDKLLRAGAGGAIADGDPIDNGNFFAGKHLTYGAGNWIYSRFDNWWRIASDGLSIVANGTIGTGPSLGHKRAGSSGKTFHARNGVSGMVVGENNLASNTLISDSDMSPSQFIESLAVDPSGMILYAWYGAGQKGKSTDAGASWLALASLPFGNWRFAYAGSPDRWVAAGGSSIRYTEDGGTIWANKEGNLLQVAPLADIDAVLVVGY
jgi:hypothetical protein